MPTFHPHCQPYSLLEHALPLLPVFFPLTLVKSAPPPPPLPHPRGALPPPKKGYPTKQPNCRKATQPPNPQAHPTSQPGRKTAPPPTPPWVSVCMPSFSSAALSPLPPTDIWPWRMRRIENMELGRWVVGGSGVKLGRSGGHSREWRGMTKEECVGG
jgi:hypothetical protein